MKLVLLVVGYKQTKCRPPMNGPSHRDEHTLSFTLRWLILRWLILRWLILCELILHSSEELLSEQIREGGG